VAKTYVLPARYSNADLWTIASTSVREANRLLTNVKPLLSTPLSKYIPDSRSSQVYYAKLQDVLHEEFATRVDFVTNPPIAFAAMGGKDFMALAEAVQKKLKALAK
jgi:hypothetical protein